MQINTERKSPDFSNAEIKKFPKNSPDICDDLEWFVDIAGYKDVILFFINNKLGHKNGNSVTIKGDGRSYDIYTRMNDEVIESSPKGTAKQNFPNGLIFDGAHWYHKKDKIIIDSYLKNHQIKGTAHFCQTFALIYYLGIENDPDTKLEVREYSNNIKKAIYFWEFFLENSLELRKIFMDQIKNFWGAGKGGDLPVQEICVPLKKRLSNFTYTDLKKFMKWAKQNSDQFINCKQG